MNSSVQSIKGKLKRISVDKKVNFNTVLRFYMYDRFVERLSKSIYRDNFILKGGFYLSSLFGINSRSTMDIDAAIRKTPFTKDILIKMINSIISIDLKDNVVFEIEKAETIREEDEYGGIRFTIIFKLDRIRDKFHIDLVTGEPIFPHPYNFNYESIIDNSIYKVWSYSLETLLAEKIETILNKLETSSRMKDYYDIYLIYKFKYKSINQDNFKIAIDKTFKSRHFNDNILTNYNIIENSEILRKKWISYSRKNKYANKIKFEDVLNSLKQFIDIITKKD